MLDRDYPDEPPELPIWADFDPSEEDITPPTKETTVAFIIKKGTDFIPAPEGFHHAVCVDVIDLGMVNTGFGPKHKMRVVWEIEPTMPDGKRFTVRKQYTVSLHEKSSLRKDLRAWRTRDFTSEELDGFDVEKVIGAPCQLLITHAEKEGTLYANVAAVHKAAKKLAPSGQYVRQRDRPGANGSMPAGSEPEPEYAAEEIPF
jgi:hypothetical protein